MTVTDARDFFRPTPGVAYLDAATYGLPPRTTVETLARALKRWEAGTADWVTEWDLEAEACRELFAQLIGASKRAIALVPTVSVGVGMVAASLEPGTEVLMPEEEFTSVVYPMLVAERARGVRVREAPFADLASAVAPTTGLVAFSLTQAQSGKTAALADIADAARHHGARVLVDATHALPFVPVADALAGIDYLVCHGYKHLLCPRGVGFFYVREDRWDDIDPYLANWRTGTPRYTRSYGGPLALASDAAKFDVSLAWHAWAGARPSLELLVQWAADGTLAGVLALSRRLADGLNLEPPTSSIVCLPVADPAAAEAELARAGIKCAARGKTVRFSPHVYNTPDEIDRAIAAADSLKAAVR